MPSRKALQRALTKAATAVRAVVFVALTLTAVSLAMPTPAYAGFSCDFTGDDSYQMDTPGTNGESMFAAVMQWDKDTKQSTTLLDDSGTTTGAVKMPNSPDTYTMYELDGMRGMNWSQTFKGQGDASENNGDWGSGADDCSVMSYINNGVADSILNGTKIFTRAAISIKESASNPSPLAGLYEGRDSVVTTLKENVLRPAVPVMILLVGLWVFTKWRKGDMREVWAGISWSALTIVAVTAFLTGGNYDKFVGTADSYIARANSALTEVVLAGVSGETQSPCDLDKGAYNRGLRISSCAMYDTLVFRPWALGQFGDAGKNCIFKKEGGGEIRNGVCVPAEKSKTCDWGKGARCEDLRVIQLVAQSKTNVDAFSGKKLDKFKDDWIPIRQEIAGGKDKGDDVGDMHIYPVSFDEWAGKNAGNRVGLAFYSIIAALIVGLMVIVLSGLTLLWHAVTLILVILLPLVATIGIHPSQQKLLKSWLETFIHSFVLRAGFGVILTVLLVLYQMILPAKVALGTQLLMLLLVTIAIVMMLKKLLGGNFTPQVAGGEDMLGIRDAAGKVTAMAPGLAASTAKTSGRVASGGAKGVAWTADRVVTGGKGRDKMQQWGWIGQSKREQRKTQRQSAETTRMKYEQTRQEHEARSAPEPESSPAPKRSGRVSGSTSKPAPQPTAPAEPRPAPAPSPAPAPAPKLPQQQAQPPAPRPRPAPAEPPASPTPPPAPRDPRGPSGRV
ncbi:hypothetical protein [Streptomyces sp. NBC_01235]|uniref:hypothetical protein n=1 Tax=Streptomyces sp. NBC_01235 TaxID=2903788 RepID=UPI002E10EA0E|nr:hypothetical protein OG289_27525 [Streptomyces sp. NBC_01235]